jgi:CheY-like chemotaxis protein
MQKFTQKTVLMIENNPDHIELALDAFDESGLPFSIKVLRTENEALDYLFRKNAYRDPDESPRPRAIMIDVKTSGWQGFHILEKIQADIALHHIPVIMLSACENLHDVQLSTDLGAEDFMLKPLEPVYIEKQFKRLGLI